MGSPYRKREKKAWRMPEEANTAMVKGLLALGFWVQGFRCFPWMAVNFFLKDGLQLDPSTLQILLYSASLPMVAKPFYGILSDAVPIAGMKRLPYVAIGAALQALSWFVIVLLPPALTSTVVVSACLFTSNLGASIAEVANDALVVEAGNTRRISLQSFAWMFGALGGALGNLLGGLTLDWTSPRGIFLIFGIIAVLQLLVTSFLSGGFLQPPPTKAPPPSKDSRSLRREVSVRSQISTVRTLVGTPEVYRPLLWLSISYAVVPVLFGTMFFYQTRQLNLGSSTIGFSKVSAQVCLMLWSFSYNQWLRDVSPRSMLRFLQGVIVLFVVLDLLLVTGFSLTLGIPDSTYVALCGGLVEALMIAKILPFSILMARLCPPGCEGSLMALVMSTVALSMIVSGFAGVFLASYLGVSGDDFSSLPRAIAIEAACAALPMYLCSLVPARAGKMEHRAEEEEAEHANWDAKDK